MANTFDPTLADDVSKVRFHIGDTDVEHCWIADETITALVSMEGDIQHAALACIKYIITQLSTPDFKKDWLSVSPSTAREGYEKMLKTKATEFGISLQRYSFQSSVSLASRSDSYMTDGLQDGAP